MLVRGISRVRLVSRGFGQGALGIRAEGHPDDRPRRMGIRNPRYCSPGVGQHPGIERGIGERAGGGSVCPSLPPALVIRPWVQRTEAADQDGHPHDGAGACRDDRNGSADAGGPPPDFPGFCAVYDAPCIGLAHHQGTRGRRPAALGLVGGEPYAGRGAVISGPWRPAGAGWWPPWRLPPNRDTDARHSR